MTKMTNTLHEDPSVFLRAYQAQLTKYSSEERNIFQTEVSEKNKIYILSIMHFSFSLNFEVIKCKRLKFQNCYALHIFHCICIMIYCDTEDVCFYIYFLENIYCHLLYNTFKAILLNEIFVMSSRFKKIKNETLMYSLIPSVFSAFDPLNRLESVCLAMKY